MFIELTLLNSLRSTKSLPSASIILKAISNCRVVSLGITRRWAWQSEHCARTYLLRLSGEIGSLHKSRYLCKKISNGVASCLDFQVYLCAIIINNFLSLYTPDKQCFPRDLFPTLPSFHISLKVRFDPLERESVDFSSPWMSFSFKNCGSSSAV